MLGNFLFGVEIAGRFGDERAALSVVTTSSFFGQTGTTTSSYEIKNDAGLHVSGRLGAALGDTLMFVRGGAGVTHISEIATFDARNLTPCTFFAGCLTVAVGSKERWTPSATIGAGIEQNFGSFFARAEGEIEAIALHNTILSTAGNAGAAAEPYWFARVIASVGMRF
jgi:hypothetical protein